MNNIEKTKILSKNIYYCIEVLVKELNKYDKSYFREENKTLMKSMISDFQTSLMLIKKGKLNAYISLIRSTFESFYFFVALLKNPNQKINMNTRLVDVQKIVEDLILEQDSSNYILFKSINYQKNKKGSIENKVDLIYYYEYLCKQAHVTPIKLENIEIESENNILKSTYSVYRLDALVCLITYIIRFLNIDKFNKELIVEVLNCYDICQHGIYNIYLLEMSKRKYKYIKLIKNKYIERYKHNYEVTGKNVLNNPKEIQNFDNNKFIKVLKENGYYKKYEKINKVLMNNKN